MATSVTLPKLKRVKPNMTGCFVIYFKWLPVICFARTNKHIPSQLAVISVSESMVEVPDRLVAPSRAPATHAPVLLLSLMGGVNRLIRWWFNTLRHREVFTFNVNVTVELYVVKNPWIHLNNFTEPVIKVIAFATQKRFEWVSWE